MRDRSRTPDSALHNNPMRFQATAGAVFAGLAVVFGAFGAHGLKGTIPPERLETFQTGVQYQLAHGIALLLLAALHGRLACNHRAQATAWLFTAGIVLFSGSLYALALTGMGTFGMIAPLGGLSMIVGWAVFAVNAGLSRPPSPDHSTDNNPQSP